MSQTVYRSASYKRSMFLMSKPQVAATVQSTPSRTVTFLFTDIEGSTKLWEEQPEMMRAALARHDALVRRSIETNQGQVFKTVGDAFCAVFATVTDAVAAALAAQQALHVERWPDTVTIRARMALHTGAAEFREGDFFGRPLNHVARLLALGHGGQTLISEITHDLCHDRLPPGTALKSLGEHSLKDLASRETVFQLCHPDLPHTFPRLKMLLTPIDENVPSIAVLPFTDLSPEKDQEYFTAGLAEELLSVLTKIRGLRVASRTSAFSFKGMKVDLLTVAQKLNVATILEGSVRKAGKRVRITAQLVQVATDSQLWSATYDRDLKDIFAVQDDIAQSVVKELRLALLGEIPDVSASAAAEATVQAAAKGRGENAEAYRLYLQGRFFEDRFTRSDTAKAIVHYRQALQIDPHYALAWAALSRAYNDQASYTWDLTVAEGYAKAREAAEQALQLEPDLAEGHVAMGTVRMYYDWDWRGADASLCRALELAPGDAQIIHHMAWLAGSLGRLDEAVELLRRAVVLDPLSVQAHRSLGRMCFVANRLEEAEVAINKALELNPQVWVAHWFLGLVRLTQGSLEEARGEFEQEGHEAFRLLGLAMMWHTSGRRTESDAKLCELIEKDAAAGASQIALGFAYRGDTDLAFEWLERAYAQRDPGIGHMKIWPQLRSLHDDPRWQPLLEKMGLAD